MARNGHLLINTLFGDFLTFFVSFSSLPFPVSWDHFSNPCTQILVSEPALGGAQMKALGFLTIILTWLNAPAHVWSFYSDLTRM